MAQEPAAFTYSVPGGRLAFHQICSFSSDVRNLPASMPGQQRDGAAIHVDVHRVSQAAGRLPPSAQVLEAHYLQCCVWSIGAALVQTADDPHRDRLDGFLRQRACRDQAGGDAVPLSMLPEQSLFDVFVDEEAGAWKARPASSAPWRAALLARVLCVWHDDKQQRLPACARLSTCTLCLLAAPSCRV